MLNKCFFVDPILKLSSFYTKSVLSMGMFTGVNKEELFWKKLETSKKIFSGVVFQQHCYW